MNASKSPIPFTYEDYKSLPESLEQHELIDGELYVSPAPTTTHQIVAQNIEFALLRHVRDTGCGRMLHSPVDVDSAKARSATSCSPISSSSTELAPTSSRRPRSSARPTS